MVACACFVLFNLLEANVCELLSEGTFGVMSISTLNSHLWFGPARAGRFCSWFRGLSPSAIQVRWFDAAHRRRAHRGRVRRAGFREATFPGPPFRRGTSE